jgi:transposase
LYEDSESAMISAMSSRITHKPTALAAAHTCVAAQASTVAQDTAALDTSDAQALIVQLKAQIQSQQTQLKFEQTRNAALNLEVARLKNWRFGTSSESMDAASSGQSDLFDAKTLVALAQEAGAEDRAQADAFAALHTAPRAKQKPKRQSLPSQLERIIHRHEIEPATCPAGHLLTRIGEEISERLDCVPAQFFVHRHIRGKYCCAACQTVLAADMPAQIIDKGIPAAGLLAQVIIAKHDDHLPLFRQEEIYRRSGAFIARSSMAGWVGQCAAQLMPLVAAMKQHLKLQSVIHADETPVKLLAPGSGKTHQAYVWAYRSSDLETQVLLHGQSPPLSNTARCVIYEFATSRAGEHARAMLQGWRGTLLTDDYSGYKALFAAGQVKEAGCWAHARRKFFEAHKLNKSEIAAEAVQRIAQLYAIERQVQGFSSQERWQIRQAQSRPLLEEFKAWLTAQRMQLADADVTAKAIDYTTKRWAALTLHLEDANLPIDNNAVENAMRPIALGRKNWLFVGSETAGERAACLMSLIESAKLNGHDAWQYLKDILTKLPTWPNSRLQELLPHNWQAPAQA